MTENDKAIVHMGDGCLVHVERQLQLVFQYFTALFVDLQCLRLRAFDDDDKVISVSKVGNGGFPLPLFPHSNLRLLPNTGVPVR